MISISIVALITSAFLASTNYLKQIQKSRDTRRQSDLKAIQNALEQYYSNCDEYPDNLPEVGNSLSDCTGNIVIQRMPADPKTNESYNTVELSPDGYRICADEVETLEYPPCIQNLQ